MEDPREEARQGFNPDHVGFRVQKEEIPNTVVKRPDVNIKEGIFSLTFQSTD